jgi:hypothetical protein
MNKILTFATSLFALFCLLPALASARTRYATPDGTGPVATCPQADPCDLADAMDYYVLRDGDEVVFGPGIYEDPDGYMGVSKAVYVHGAAGEPRPVIQETNNGVFIDNDQAKIADLRIEASGSANALSIRRGMAERVDVRSINGTACFVAWATVRDSVCASSSSSGLSSGYANPYTYEIKLRNVTAVTTSPFPYASAISLDPGPGNHMTLDAKNVIAFNADPTGNDVYAGGTGTNSSATLAFAASNYDHAAHSAGGSITEAGSGSNLTDPPLFVDLAAGDLREAAGSPTINAGTDDALNGTSDLDGAERVFGDGIDMGAYEFVPQPDPPADDPTDDPASDPVPVATDPPAGPAPDDSIHPIADGPTPQTTITKAPAGKVRARRVTVRFTSDQPSAGFACSVDGGSYGSCASPFTVRLSRGRHTIDVRASLDGRVDPTPARAKFKIARHARRR